MNKNKQQSPADFDDSLNKPALNIANVGRESKLLRAFTLSSPLRSPATIAAIDKKNALRGFLFKHLDGILEYFGKKSSLDLAFLTRIMNM